MTAVVQPGDIRLLERCVMSRFRHDAQSNAVVLALEGLRWLLGKESRVTRQTLEREWQDWQTFWAKERAAGRFAPPEEASA